MFRLYKFGGSILKNANDVHLIASVVKKEKSINVFSAFFGITDALLLVSKMASNRYNEYEMQLELINNFHINICRELEIEYDFVESIFAEINNLLNALFQIEDLPLKILDRIISYGELLSSKIIHAYLNKLDPLANILYVDARHIIKTNSNYGRAVVNIESTSDLVKQAFREDKTYIVAGFIASDLDNNTTTLGRNGSDYSAALIASILDANEITIWKDVDGLSTADPKIVPDAIQINKISYKEMAELSYFGNKIITLQALQPAINKSIKIYLRNVYNLENEGTLISSETNDDFKIKGISKVDDIILVSVSGFAMVGISGFSKRVFSSLSQVNVSVVFIAQSSSETTICFGIKSTDLQRTEATLKEEFGNELSISTKKEQSIIAVAGYGMASTPGICAKIFGSLGKVGINIVAIAQDFSEMNISFSVDSSASVLAVKVIHNYLFRQKQINCLVVGIGNVGSVVVKMLQNKNEFNVIGTCNSREYNGVPYSNYDEIIKKFKDEALINCVLVDCTSSDKLVDNYSKFIENGFNVVTSNKKANTLSYDKYREILDCFKKNRKRFFYETNVGAGLPIISPLEDLIACGDEIIKIEGIFSGTLSYIFNNLSAEKSFSSIVLEAKEKGFTEPDPNDDLCGLDVGRKLLILARIIGLKINIEDVKIQSLVGINDDEILKMAKKDSVLRYVGKIENNKCSAGIEIISKDNPLASTQYTDNIISITSKYYNKIPLVVKGPGAGAEVTAIGVVNDLMRLYNTL
jgi:aspartokinase/homoserine dehydrogenase 1